MLLDTAVVGPFQCNCKLLVAPTGEALLMDPGDEAPAIQKMLKKAETKMGRSVELRYLLHTHAHLDHIGATRQMKEAFPKAQILLHGGDLPLYQNLREQCRFFGLDYGDPVATDRLLLDEEEILLGGLKLSVIYTPGHSPGSICFRLHEDSTSGAQEIVFSGDTLFELNIGRSDLWGGDEDLLLKSIRTRLFTLDDDTRVCPGHGADTMIGREKRENPYAK